jgi:hypothetical protein
VNPPLDRVAQNGERRARASASGDEATSITLLQQSRAIRLAIGDRAGVAECDAEFARIAALA